MFQCHPKTRPPPTPPRPDVAARALLGRGEGTAQPGAPGACVAALPSEFIRSLLELLACEQEEALTDFAQLFQQIPRAQGSRPFLLAVCPSSQWRPPLLEARLCELLLCLSPSP